MTCFILAATLACTTDTLPPPKMVDDRALIIQAINTDPMLKLLYRRLDAQEDVIDDLKAKGFRPDYVSIKVANNKAEIIRKKIARRKAQIIREIRGN